MICSEILTVRQHRDVSRMPLFTAERDALGTQHARRPVS